jgi:hypothetical protein
VREICGNSHEISEIVKHCLSQIFGQNFEQEHYSLQMVDHFTLHSEHFFAQL